VTAQTGFPGAPPPGRGIDGLNQWAHKAWVVINRILAGKLNCIGSVTLTANAATTTLTDVRIGGDSVVLLQAITANAAAALATTWFAAPGDGTVVINHANNAQADKTFNYAVIG